MRYLGFTFADRPDTRALVISLVLTSHHPPPCEQFIGKHSRLDIPCEERIAKMDMLWGTALVIKSLILTGLLSTEPSDPKSMATDVSRARATALRLQAGWSLGRTHEDPREHLAQRQC